MAPYGFRNNEVTKCKHHPQVWGSKTQPVLHHLPWGQVFIIN